jgi:hypothetical protein
MTVAQLLGSVDSRELSEWMALYVLEGQERKQAELAAKAAAAEQRLRGRGRGRRR